MPYNKQLFPDDYTLEVQKTITSSLEDDLDNLKEENSITAIKHAFVRRTLLYQISEIQSLSIKTFNNDYPLYTGENTKPVFIAPKQGTKALWAGGLVGDTSASAAIERFTFAGEFLATISAALSQPTRALASNSSTKDAYFAGGKNTSNADVKTINKVNYSSESASVHSRELSHSRSFIASAGYDDRGYFNGEHEITIEEQATRQKLNRVLEYRDEQRSRTGTRKSGRWEKAWLEVWAPALSNSWYAGGGPVETRFENGQWKTYQYLDKWVESDEHYTDYYTERVEYYREFWTTETYTIYRQIRVLFLDRLQYSDGSISLLSMRNFAWRTTAVGASGTGKAYFAGGGTTESVIDNFSYATETSGSMSIRLASAGAAMASFGNSNKVYFAGGLGRDYKKVDRLSVSDESISGLEVALVNSRYYTAGTSSSDKGYVTGGKESSKAIEALNFTSEVIASIGVNLNQQKSELSATSDFVLSLDF